MAKPATKEASTPPSPSKKKEMAPPPKPEGPPTASSIIGNRITTAVKEYPPTRNRSSDLVPLTREFETMRRKLRGLAAAVKAYPATLAQVDQARLEVVSTFATVAEGWPVQASISGTDNKDSLKAVTTKLSEQRKSYDQKFHSQIIQYCSEWEAWVTNTVDNGMKENKKLHESLDHYQGKVDQLRKKVQQEIEKQQKKDEKKQTTAENAATPPRSQAPTKLTQKLERNETKLNQAWRAYEKNSAQLCYLLEEVCHQGWKDLQPVLKDYMQWEMRRSSSEYDCVAQLAATTEQLTKTVETATAQRAQQIEEQRAALAAAGSGGTGHNSSMDSSYDSDTTDEEEKTPEK